MKKLFSLGVLLMLAMCAGFICSCNDDVEETPPAGSNTTDNKDPHEYVDLGLPSGTLWATCNVGANSPEGYGDYFAWGETKPKSYYDLSTYKYCKGDWKTMTKYFAYTDSYNGETVLEPSDDAATVNWGSEWQMPSEEQFDELINSSNTTTTWTTMNGKYGRKITSKSNGNSIFLPAAGCRVGAILYKAGSDGDYWSRSLYKNYSDSGYAYCLDFNSSYICTYDYGDRGDGRSVRPVRVNDVKFKTVAVSNIELNNTKLSVRAGESTQLLATVLPENATYKNVKWESSDADVATVDETGKVTAVAVGNCIITCSATDGTGVEAECKVKVKNDNSGTLDGHEYVDLDLPSGTLWATCNVGANSPEEYGDYFAWGETKPKTTYNWSTYKYCKGTETTMTKYCTVDNKTELEPSDDAATVNWGSSWQMPSREQRDELTADYYTTTIRTTMNGVYGIKITSNRNGNSIFLPAAGYLDDTGFHNEGRGDYWSRSLGWLGISNAYELGFNYLYFLTHGGRYCGYSVRPVRVKN